MWCREKTIKSDKTQTMTTTTYTTVIQKVKDDCDHIVRLRIILTVVQDAKEQKTTQLQAEAFDSNGRYFYAEQLDQHSDYIRNLQQDKLTPVYDGSYIYLLGGGWSDMVGLDEITNSPFHLKEINTQIMQTKQHLDTLEQKKQQLNAFYEF